MIRYNLQLDVHLLLRVDLQRFLQLPNRYVARSVRPFSIPSCQYLYWQRSKFNLHNAKSPCEGDNCASGGKAVAQSRERWMKSSLNTIQVGCFCFVLLTLTASIAFSLFVDGLCSCFFCLLVPDFRAMDWVLVFCCCFQLAE